ncbi:hypothetical protein IAG25_31230 [Caballeronia sp. EK]|uniref:hypothetical protein n=1 Tax=Caballeronia sp. EK TaxID=2767469 RepID=UPI0016554CBD|nr:hypothetical protein [Caballeronia sp. EK]MBC8641295.1 hypothetical protein [Caballeronia sp. EK]
MADYARGERRAGFGVDQPFEWPLHDKGERQELAGKRPLTGQQLSDFGLLGRLERVV